MPPPPTNCSTSSLATALFVDNARLGMGYLRSPEHTASGLENPETLYLSELFSCLRFAPVLYARRWHEYLPFLLFIKIYMNRYTNCLGLVGLEKPTRILQFLVHMVLGEFCPLFQLAQQVLRPRSM